MYEINTAVRVIVMAATKGKSASKSKAKSAPKASPKAKPAVKPKAKPKAKSTDWFADLDAELDKKTERAIDVDGGASSKKEVLNRTLVEDFWKIVLRFEKINIHFSIDPEYSTFAKFEKFPYEWTMKENIAYMDINQIKISDKTQSENRVGDTLRFRYYKLNGKDQLRLSFEFFEGEHYYKYSGWKRMFGEFIAYDTPVKNADLDAIHAILADIVRAWYESHLRRDRDLLLKYMDKNYEKGETYTE